jgi:K+-transporting ATPase ATPase A chain
MTLSAVLQMGLFLVLLLALAAPLGAYLARVYTGEARWAQRIGGPLERLLYRASGVDPWEDMSFQRYTGAVLLFNLLGVLVVYALLRLQGVLPLNPEGLGGVPPELAFNTAVSFGTNTNWQAYGGETTMSYLTQMLGLACRTSCRRPPAWPCWWR